MQHSAAEDSFANLARLSQKPGVKSTLILSRQTGSIVRSSGLVSRDDTANPESTLPPSNSQQNGTANGSNGDQEDGLQSAEDVARIVWNFAKAAGDLLQELNGPVDDEMKLLRIRTKKKELVIVPDSKFIAVVIHDTPSA
ncbi:hypothetical protein MBLNU459_g2956t1 [Dothideomycetes sp. NU459]